MRSIIAMAVVLIGSVAVESPSARAGAPDFGACEGRTGQDLGVCKAWVASGCSADTSTPQCQSINEINTGDPLPLACPCWTAPDLDVFLNAEHVYWYPDPAGRDWDALNLIVPEVGVYFAQVYSTTGAGVPVCDYLVGETHTEMFVSEAEYLDCRSQILAFRDANGLPSCTYDQWSSTGWPYTCP